MFCVFFRLAESLLNPRHEDKSCFLQFADSSVCRKEVLLAVCWPCCLQTRSAAWSLLIVLFADSAVCRQEAVLAVCWSCCLQTRSYSSFSLMAISFYYVVNSMFIIFYPAKKFQILLLENFMFCWPCVIVYQYSDTNVMHFLFNLLRINSFYMFRALQAQPQDVLHKRQLVYCVRVMSVGWTMLVQPTDITRTQYTKFNCAAFPEDEKGMLEKCRGP
jgi:hypothetical protein